MGVYSGYYSPLTLIIESETKPTARGGVCYQVVGEGHIGDTCVLVTLYLESVSTQTLLEAICQYKPVSVALCVRSIPILHQQPSSSLYLLALMSVSLVR